MVRDVIVDLGLEPVFWQDPPEIKITFNGRDIWAGALDLPGHWQWTLPAEDRNRLSVWFLNKQENDTQGDLDKAIKVSKLGLENMFFDNILYQSRYRPMYSRGYINYAKSRGLSADDVVYNSTYLGFNGEWYLDFPWPTFTWIYEIETNGQGWIYEKNI